MNFEEEMKEIVDLLNQASKKINAFACESHEAKFSRLNAQTKLTECVLWLTQMGELGDEPA